MSELTIVLAPLAFLVNILLIAIGGTWKLSRVEASINKNISEHKLEIEERIVESERRFGETITALRTKIHEVETWARDQFVREGPFLLGMGRIEKSVSDMSERLETRLLRMENKIDEVKSNGSS